MPNFSSPFVHDELQGVFIWTEELTDKLSESGHPYFWHAAHWPNWKSIYESDELYLRSTFDTYLGGSLLGEKNKTKNFKTDACVWASLQAWHEDFRHNHYGPYSIRFPMRMLNERRFYVYTRRIRDWKHVYFVERSIKTGPRFGPDRRATAISPERYFSKGEDGGLTWRPYRNYELVLTQPVPLIGAKHLATSHRDCRSCNGVTESKATDRMMAYMTEKFKKQLKAFPQLRNLSMGDFDLTAMAT